MNGTRILTVLVGLGLSATTAAAFSPQQKLMARRAAELDGYRQLAERVMGLRVTSTTIVRDYVTQSDVIRTDVNAFLRGARIANTRVHGDGTVEVDVEMTLATLVSNLNRYQSTRRVNGRVHSVDFSRLTQYYRYNVIRVTGMGAVGSPRVSGPAQPIQPAFPGNGGFGGSSGFINGGGYPTQPVSPWPASSHLRIRRESRIGQSGPYVVIE